MSDQEVVDFVLANDSESAQEIAKKLIAEAKRLRSTDNLSAIVIKL